VDVAANPVLECRARVVRVVDGNTLDLETDLGSPNPFLERCRLDGVAVPRLDDPDPEERRVAEHAQDFVEVLVLGKEVVVHSSGDRPDEHGRWPAVVHWRDAAWDWSNLNDDLVENGLAASTRLGPAEPVGCGGRVPEPLAKWATICARRERPPALAYTGDRTSNRCQQPASDGPGPGTTTVRATR